MADRIDPTLFTVVGEVETRYQSYNVEMAEVTGGTFWKPYTEAQRAGLEPVVVTGNPLASHGADEASGFADNSATMAPLPPVDLSGARIRTLAKALGPVYLRVSGSWASHTYFDADGSTGGTCPPGYAAVLTREQWDGLIDFAKEVDGLLVTSMANTDGAHDATGAWDPTNSRAFLEYTLRQGLPIAAAEFMNEPDVAPLLGAPKGYTAADYGRDVRIFVEMLRSVAPDTLFVGPGSAVGGDRPMLGDGMLSIPTLKTDDLLEQAGIAPAVFTYHHYYGLSERGGGMAHEPASEVLTERYLAKTDQTLDSYRSAHDRFAPGTPYWNTETGDAAMGGNTWAPTWLDVPRYVDQLGRLAKQGVTAVMHNTLCASDYALVDNVTQLPRAKYWAALLWARLMGTTVYEMGIPLREGLHAYAHSRRDGDGYALVLINTSREAVTEVALPGFAECYQLTGDELRGSTVRCNGELLQLAEDDTLPTITPRAVEGTLALPPVSVTFLTLPA